MDPKSLSNIDPKLRETYERVMGTTVAAPPPTLATPAAPSSPPPPSDVPAPLAMDSTAPSSNYSSMAMPSTPEPTNPITPPVFTPAAPADPEPAPPAAPADPQPNLKPQNLPSPASVTQNEHKTSPLLKALYLIGGIAFFAIYTIFWIKIFKIPFFF